MCIRDSVCRMCAATDHFWISWTSTKLISYLIWDFVWSCNFHFNCVQNVCSYRPFWEVANSINVHSQSFRSFGQSHPSKFLVASFQPRPPVCSLYVEALCIPPDLQLTKTSWPNVFPTRIYPRLHSTIWHCPRTIKYQNTVILNYHPSMPSRYPICPEH